MTRKRASYLARFKSTIRSIYVYTYINISCHNSKNTDVQVEKVVASLPVDDAPGTFFDKIIDGTVPADIVYQVQCATIFSLLPPV